jgi:tRNA A37 methylthiotransferase MiaB
MKISIESYGCSNSHAESEIMAGLLKKAGYSITERGADLSVIVTCFVKKPTEQKMLHRIKELSKKPLVIAGCMPEGLHDKLAEQFPKSSLLSTHQTTRVVDAVSKTLDGKRVDYTGPYMEEKLCLPRVRKNPLVGIIPISSGCNSSCSYCCVRLAKGSLRSYSYDDIIKDIKLSLKDGCREIWLTAQDTASYGMDGKGSLPKLLTGVSELKGDFFTRSG